MVGVIRKRTTTFVGHQLPNLYQELQYVTSPNGIAAFKLAYQYFISGKKPGFVYRFHVYLDSSKTANTNMFGVWASSGYRDWEVCQRPHNHSSMPSWAEFQNTTTSGTKYYNFKYNYNGNYIQQVSYLNGTLTCCDGTTASVTDARQPSSSAAYIGVGNLYDAGNNVLLTGSNRRPHDIAYLALYHDSVMEYELIPCKRLSDNKIGMYDKVNKVFHSSETGTEFTAGPRL
jgi:hypothetical protein